MPRARKTPPKKTVKKKKKDIPVRSPAEIKECTDFHAATDCELTEVRAFTPNRWGIFVVLVDGLKDMIVLRAFSREQALALAIDRLKARTD